MTASRIGESIRAARERIGWSREALAYHSGLSWAAIAQIESGRRREVRVTTLAALANALGVSIDHLADATIAATPPLLGHRGLLYSSDDEFLAGTVPFLARGVERAERVLVVLPERPSGLLRDGLGGSASAITFEDASQWYRSPIEAVDRYRAYINEQLASGASWIRVVAEIVLRGGSRAELDAWARYEALFNVAFATIPATFCCTYDAGSSPKRIVDHMRHTHPEMAAGDGGTVNPHYETPEQVILTH
jgi:transcriptional regulator with XRE-family HTH domain